MWLFDNMSALRRSFAASGAGFALIAMLVAAQPACAATDIEGSPDDVVLRVQNAPIAGVLAALAARFQLTYKAPASLTRELSGRYSGSLNQVLARILDDVDYVAEASDAGIKLVILNPADKAKASALGAPDNRSGNGPAALPASAALQAQARPAPAGGAPQNGAIQAATIQSSQPASSPMARQPLLIPGNAPAAAIPPLTSFLPTGSPETRP